MAIAVRIMIEVEEPHWRASEQWFGMRHGGTWSLSSQVEKFGPILISKGNIFSGHVNFSFLKEG